MSPSSSSSSACYTVSGVVTAACETERDLSAMLMSGGKDLRASGGFQFGITRKLAHPDSNSALRVSKDSHRIRKPPLPLPQVQYRPPIIIHTHSPKIIHTQPDGFMSLVQKLTGSSDTRLRLVKSPSAASKKRKQVRNEQSADATTTHERQGSGGSSSSATVTNCGSPSSSEDSATFLATDQPCHGTRAAAACVIKQSNSPRSPLDSNFEFDNGSESLLNQFSGFADASGGCSSSTTTTTTMFHPQVKTEPMFSFHESNNFFVDFMQHPGAGAAQLHASGTPPPSRPTSKPVHHHHHHHHQDLMSPYGDNIALAPNLPAGLLDLSPPPPPQGWSQSNLLDCLTGSHFMNQAPMYLRQRQFASGPTYTASPEGTTMVPLENIHTFMSSIIH